MHLKPTTVAFLLGLLCGSVPFIVVFFLAAFAHGGQADDAADEWRRERGIHVEDEPTYRTKR